MGVPKFALAPLLILWFGIGDAPKAEAAPGFITRLDDAAARKNAGETSALLQSYSPR